MTVSPVYKIKEYTVVFVDWSKETVTLENFEHGQPLVAPEIENTDESYVVGWDAVIDGTRLVTSDMVVTAKYEKKAFVVNLYDETGEILNSVEVEYGDEVETPASLENENIDLFGWVTDGDMEHVTEDLTVVPVYQFKETVETPKASINTGEYTSSQEVTLTCDTEGAVIYYTLNGENPRLMIFMLQRSCLLWILPQS